MAAAIALLTFSEVNLLQQADWGGGGREMEAQRLQNETRKIPHF